MHVAKGDRIFLVNTDSHAEVLRESILGFTSSVATECDDNIIRMYCGSDMNNVVNSTTGKDFSGEDIDVPVDVREIGPAVLTSLGISTDQQTALFQKFMVLPKATRREQLSGWAAAKDDPALKATFLTSLLSVLDEDDTFIRVQAGYLLGHLDEDVRNSMLVKLYELTDDVSRTAMIVEYTLHKKDKKKTEEFLQGMYEMTLDTKTYLRMELKRASMFRGNRLRTTGNDVDTRIDAMFADKSDATLDQYARNWRNRKYYRILRTASRYSYILLRNY